MTKVALAFSGSLDTTLCIHWLKEHHNLEVITLSVDVGIRADLVSLGDRAIQAGASSAHVLDLRETFCKKYILPAVTAHLQKTNGDPLATALGRPPMCQALVELAREHGAPYVAHGCKPESNDNVRFENELLALDNKLKVINPIREWPFKNLEDKLRYIRTHNIAIEPVLKTNEWSLDGNLWGLATARSELNETWTPSPESSYQIVTPLDKTPNEPTVLTIEFEKGVPVSLDGRSLDILSLVQDVIELGCRHGIGHHDIIYHKLNGMKARKIVESPGATLLTSAHKALEEITLDNDTSNFKQQASAQYRRLVAQGHWFSQLRESLDCFFKSTQEWVTGAVQLELFKGSVRILGRKSPHSLYGKQAHTGPSSKWLRTSLQKKAE